MRMSRFQSPESRVEETDSQDLPVVDGELIEASGSEKLTKTNERKLKNEVIKQASKNEKQKPNLQSAYRNYLLVPVIFLVVTLLGGLRLDAATNAFLFLKPALVCLIFAAVLLLLFFRGGLLKLDGWFSENFSTVKNIANAAILFTLFTASTQIFNSLLPERGLPFWMVSLLFFWTLWNNLFSVFDAKRLLQSLGGLFALAFVVKYLILASLSFANDATWTQKILESVMKEASFGLIDLPKFADGTGYIQFFTLVFYLLGLFLLKPRMDESE
ncbi:MAG: hypothetical protein ACR2N3_12815 [Pyrinomonadaceae bacterium]